MTNIEIINIIAILCGPTSAVIITLCYQARKEKRSQKYELFKTLMRCRKDFEFVNQDWVDSLNLIDVVYHDNKQAVKLWHSYQEMLGRSERSFAEENRKYLDLLHALALDLGYKNIQQTDIDRYYQPVGLGERKALDEALKREQLRSLQISNSSVSSQNQPPEVLDEYYPTNN